MKGNLGPLEKERILAYEEVKRQASKVEREARELGYETELVDSISALDVAVDAFKIGMTTMLEVDQRLWESGYYLAKIISTMHGTDDIASGMAFDAQFERETRDGAQLLASYLARDAFRGAGAGCSADEWIKEVVSYPSVDPETRRERIALLQEEGPWPWPRDLD